MKALFIIIWICIVYSPTSIQAQSTFIVTSQTTMAGDKGYKMETNVTTIKVAQKSVKMIGNSTITYRHTSSRLSFGLGMPPARVYSSDGNIYELYLIDKYNIILKYTTRNLAIIYHGWYK